MNEKRNVLASLKAPDLTKMKHAVSEKLDLSAVSGVTHLEAADYGREFLNVVARLRGVRIDRAQFLRAELRKAGISQEQAEAAVLTTPGEALVPEDVLTAIARGSINLETHKSTAMSVLTGIPGGFAMLGTVPADLTQYYVHAFRIMQKLAYVYGWKEFLHDAEEVDDETLAKLSLFLGVMVGASGAAAGLTTFAHQTARPAIQKRIAKTALTKTPYYPVIKSVLGLVGVKVTKDSFAKSVSKVVPVVGGVISGAMTYASLKPQALRLMKHLSTLPQAGGPVTDADVIDVDGPSGEADA